MHDVAVDAKKFNKELEKVMGKTSQELYDKKGLLNKKKSNKRAVKRQYLKKVLHPLRQFNEAKVSEPPVQMDIDTSIDNNEVLTNKLKIKIPEDSNAKYKIIGFVTSGNYSLLKGCGHGIGYILNHAGNIVVGENGKVSAFVRNPNGRLYYPCTLKMVNLSFKL